MNLVEAVVVDRIENELAVADGIDETGFAKDGQVLGSYRLFKAELYIDLGNRHFPILVNQLHDLLPKLVINGSEDQRSLLKLDYINAQFCGW